MNKQTKNLALLAGVGALAYFLSRSKKASASSSTPGKRTPGSDARQPDSGDAPGRDDTSPGEPPKDQTPDTEGPLPPGTQKRDAPPMNVEQTTALALEDARARALGANVVTEELVMGEDPDFSGPIIVDKSLGEQVAILLGVPGGRTLASWLTDQTYFEVTKTAGKIPDQSDRGAGWQKYIDLWNRIYDHIVSLLYKGLATAEGF